MRIRLSGYQSDILLRRKPGLDIEQVLSLERLEDHSLCVVFKDRIFGWRIAIIPEKDTGRQPEVLMGEAAEHLQERITELLASGLEPEELESQFWDMIGQLHSLPLPREFESSL